MGMDLNIKIIKKTSGGIMPRSARSIIRRLSHKARAGVMRFYKAQPIRQRA